MGNKWNAVREGKWTSRSIRSPVILEGTPMGLYRAWFRHAVQVPIENETQYSEGAKEFLGFIITIYVA